jgi:uncharacterized protein
MLGAHFEWDPNKDDENQRKHGVTLVDAQYAFADPCRVIAEDVSHSDEEQQNHIHG